VKPAFFALALSLALSAHAEPRITAPADLTVPDPAPVRVEGVRPGSRVTLETIRRSYDGKESYVATATFVADRRGRIDTSAMAPQDGSYTDVDPIGLFWSGRARAHLDSDPAADTVAIAARADGKIIARAVAATEPDPAGMTIRRDTPFPGAVWAVPKTPGAHPVIIILGGSDGGSSTAREMAPLFAARGYATLGLPYYDPGYDPTDRVAGLPTSFTEIPVDRLAAVREWLVKQPEADAARMGIWGASKGGEFALIAASRYDWIRAIAAIVPSDLVWEGWGAPGPSRSSFSFGGKPLPFQPYAGMDAELAKAAKGQAMDIRKVHAAGRVAYPERMVAARIPIERYHGALLVAGGGRDTVWPSAEMVSNIVATRKAAGLETEAFIVSDAGHALGGPGTSPALPLTVNGGEAAAIAHTRADVWRATFRMFDQVLNP
jgi:dienelactone hydrolase